MNRRIPVTASALAAAAMLAGTGASYAAAPQGERTAPASASASSAPSAPSTQGAKCTYKGYSGWGLGESVSRKGKGTPKYKNGFTKRGGRSLQLSTGRIHDRSAATLNHPKKGDKVWVTISHSKGKNWASCGHKTAKKSGGALTSTKYLHSGSIKNRYMRACAKTNGKVWCADIGNKSNRKHSDNKKRYWWTDS